VPVVGCQILEGPTSLNSYAFNFDIEADGEMGGWGDGERIRPIFFGFQTI